MIKFNKIRKQLICVFLAIGSLLMFSSCDTSNAPTKYRLTIEAQPAKGGTVTPANGKYKAGTKVDIMATPTDGWRFVGWQGDYQGTNRSATVTVNSDMHIVGKFTKKKYPLTVKVEGQGTISEKVISAETTNNHPYKTKVQLTAQPADGWKFVKWKGDLSGSKNPAIITITKAMTITAVFKEVNKNYTLTVKIKGKGNVKKDPDKDKYDEGTAVALTAIADTASGLPPHTVWLFNQWKGDLVSTDNPATITMDKNKTVKAVFNEGFKSDFELKQVKKDADTVENILTFTLTNLLPKQAIIKGFYFYSCNGCYLWNISDTVMTKTLKPQESFPRPVKISTSPPGYTNKVINKFKVKWHMLYQGKEFYLTFTKFVPEQ